MFVRAVLTMLAVLAAAAVFKQIVRKLHANKAYLFELPHATVDAHGVGRYAGNTVAWFAKLPQ